MRSLLTIALVFWAGSLLAQRPPVVPEGFQRSLCDTLVVQRTGAACCEDRGKACEDRFGPFGPKEQGMQFSLKVFNRWGELMWETEDPMDQWMFTYHDKQIKSGVYVWVAEIKCGGSTKKYSDHFTFIH